MTATPPRPARRASKLKLRRPADIALAFVLGPTAGLTVFFVLILAAGAADPSNGLRSVARMSLAFFYIYMLIFGGLVCLAVELVFITPLLVGFHRWRWRWLNGWTGAAIGFALAFLPTLFIVASATPPHQNEVDWGLTTVAGGHRTAAGWVLAIAGCAAVGLVGLTAASVFRLLAVRRAESAEDAF